MNSLVSSSYLVAVSHIFILRKSDSDAEGTTHDALHAVRILQVRTAASSRTPHKSLTHDKLPSAATAAAVMADCSK